MTEQLWCKTSRVQLLSSIVTAMLLEASALIVRSLCIFYLFYTNIYEALEFSKINFGHDAHDNAQAILLNYLGRSKNKTTDLKVNNQACFSLESCCYHGIRDFRPIAWPYSRCLR